MLTELFPVLDAGNQHVCITDVYKRQITDREEFKKGILAREANGTTGIGGGIAIPHSKNKAVTKAGLALSLIHI